MERFEARSAAKSLYLLSASLAGLDVSSESPEGIADLVDKGGDLVKEERRPEAVANLLRIIATALLDAQYRNDKRLHENSVMAARDQVCPVYPFD